MLTERDKEIQAQYDKILARVVGGKLYGEYISNPKELVVAAYCLGLLERLPDPLEKFFERFDEQDMKNA